MPKGTISNARRIIEAEKLINLLQDNVLDDNAAPLNQNKLHAIKILLAKAIPDLKAIEHTGVIEVLNAAELSDAELAGIASAGRTGTSKQESSEKVTH